MSVHPDPRVHLDHNATTPIRPQVLALLHERSAAIAGNPSSVHASGRQARAWLDEARERAAVALGCHEEEIVFTSGGTESIQLAIHGAMQAAGGDGALVTTVVEHSAVLAAAAALGERGRRAVHLPVNRQGFLELAALDQALDGGAALVSVQAANNELGTLQPLGAVRERIAAHGGKTLLHTDAVQAPGRIPCGLRDLGADLASFSLHKLGGPVGVGILLRRRRVPLAPLLGGGSQEGGVRPGTENVPGVCAGVLALELALAEQPLEAPRLRGLCRLMWRELQRKFPGVELNGPPLDSPERLPNTLNVSIPSAEGRTLVARLDLEGLETSAGSACASGSIEPSHVLQALGLPAERARAALRLSFGRTSGEQDVHSAVEILGRTAFPAR